MIKYDEQFKKLQDLEFEYNIARLSCQDEDIVRKAKGKYIRQLNKVLRIQKNEDVSDKTQEE